MLKNTPLLLLMPKTIQTNSSFVSFACGKQSEMAARDNRFYMKMHIKVCPICKNRKNQEVEQSVCKLEKGTGKKMVVEYEIKYK